MGQRHAPAAFYPRERRGTHCTGGWVGPRAVLDRCGKSLTGIRSPDRPARNQSLYRLSYPAHTYNKLSLKFRLEKFQHSTGQTEPSCRDRERPEVMMTVGLMTGVHDSQWTEGLDTKAHGPTDCQ
jgi:hypothetical protein